MKGQVIGKSMPHGYAGSYARQADMVVDTHLSEGEIAFGAPVVLGTAGAVNRGRRHLPQESLLVLQFVK